MAKWAAWDGKAEALRALARGESMLSAAELSGVPYPVVRYWVKLSGMKLKLGRGGGLAPVPSTSPSSKPVTYRRLTLADRSYIQAALSLTPPLGVRAIARELGRSPSAVSREIQAHQQRHRKDHHYDAEIAQYLAAAGRGRERLGKLANPALRAEVVTRLNLKFSPEQVAGQLKLEFPEQPEMHVSHETIYQALYVQGKGALRHELTVVKALRSGRTGRKPQSKLPPRPSRPWLEGARLSDRPAEVEDRAIPGHWEGDLVVGPNNSGIVTLVERQTRYVLLGRLPGMRDSRTVLDVMRGMVTDLPADLLHSITWDQGSEMAEHASFTVTHDCAFYFCDPHSPWQRGTNENTNGLLRDFYPKGTDFNMVSDEDLAKTQWLLNIRPRKTLGFVAPGEKLDALIQGVALAP